MRDVIGLLEAYGDHAAATVQPVELDEIIRPLDLEEVVERRLPPTLVPLRSRPRWAVALVAAIVVLALVGGMALLVQLSAGEEPPVITQPPAPTTSLPAPTTTVTTTPTAPASPGLPSFSWVRVDDPNVFGGAGDRGIDRITAMDAGLFALGFDSLAGERDAAMWRSADGVTWVRVPDDAGVFAGPGGQSISTVTRVGERLIAVGAECLATGEFCRAAVWASEDEQTWVRLPHDPVFEAEGWFGMADIITWDEGLLAVGDSVWTSPDGLTWERVPEPFVSSASMWRATRFTGGIVAVGTDVTGGAVEGAIWMSTDGENWSRITGGDALFPTAQNMGVSMVADIEATPGGLIAVGTVGTQSEGGDSAVWISTDGLNWDRIEVRSRGRSEELWGVGHTDGILMAVGSQADIVLEQLGSAQVFVSDDDGLSWSRLPDDPLFGNYNRGDTYIVDVTGYEGKFIAVGGDGDTAAVWIGTPEQ